MATPRLQDPLERMLAATLLAGECLNDMKAPFGERWRVPMENGAEMTFSEPTGNRLMMRGLIARHPAERADDPKPVIRFVPVPEASVKPAPAPVKPEGPAPKKSRQKPNLKIEKPAARDFNRSARVVAQSLQKPEAEPDDTSSETPSRRSRSLPLSHSDFWPWPQRCELITLLDRISNTLAITAGRWDSGIPAEIRTQLLADVYHPTVRMLLRAKRRTKDLNRFRSAWIAERTA